MTKVINMLGGPGTGKSTTAAALYAEMKMRGMSVELVQEYVKSWAYENRPVTSLDQLYIFAKQARRERQLYEHVDFIVTDSPVLLSAFYERKYADNTVVSQCLPEYMRVLRAEGVSHMNFVLERHKPYETKGRYQTEDEAKQVDVEIDKWLRDNGYPFETITCNDRARAGFIIDLMARDADAT